MLRNTTWLFSVLFVCGNVAVAQNQLALSQPKQPEKAPVVTPPKEPATPAPKTAAQKLEAAARLYADAKAYKDSGTVHLKMITKQMTINDDRPFSTVFERDGRFKWEFRSNAMPGGKPDSRFVVWSKDQKSFQCWWDLMPELESHESLEMAMAGPTGVSGGSATAIIPLLRPDMKWGMKTTAVKDAKESGTEKFDDVECAVIEGTRELDGSKIKIWLDPGMAIRKIFEQKEIDPSKIPGVPAGGSSEKFTVETTITIKPVFDEPITDKDVEFTPPKK